MFKPIGQLIHKTPWWGLILGGLTTLAILVLFALPVHVIRLVDSGTTPAENRAIQREIGLAVGDRALTLAQGVVSAMKERTTDTGRQREFDRALAEIDRARVELTQARNNANDTGIASAREAAASAMESAADAAQSALEAATEAREAVEEARNDAVERLSDKGLDVSATLQSFAQLVAAARDNEKSAHEALNALRALHPDDQATPPAQPGTPGGHMSLVLSPAVKGDIHAKVGGDVWRVAVGSALILAFIPLFVVVLIAKFFIGRSRKALALADRKTQEAQRSDVSRQVTEARLQALQAQVEPHFLYNTLANVQALNEVDPPAANLMVGHLIQYLRASLPKMRESTSTIGQELERVRAYLAILQMRMDKRLAFSIEAPTDLLACAFPPMMLPSLVENAIKHGLEPLRDGGRIDVVVQRLTDADGECLRVEVRDTGKGLSDAPTQTGSGVGLSNLRERLGAIYGMRGRFSLTSNLPQGVVSAIEVPLQSAAAYQETMSRMASPPQAQDMAAPATTRGWRRIWNATSKTHSVWARLLARTFMVLMATLAGLLMLAFIALLTGWLPVQMGDLQLDGIESLAVGSVGLLIGFGAAALAVAILVGVLYGLGFLVAALLVFIAAAIVIGLAPVLAPFILLSLVVWWVVTKRKP